eukprot:1811571-Alexandrium_andersonii.AAC.1
MHPTLILQAVHYTHEDGAQGDVLLLHPVAREEEDALLRLEGGGMEKLGATKHFARDLPRE